MAFMAVSSVEIDEQLTLFGSFKFRPGIYWVSLVFLQQ